MTPERGAGEDQERYARFLAWGTNAGFVLLAVGFLAYVAGLVDPKVPHEDIARMWTLSSGEWLAEHGLAQGWDWLRFAHRGDFMNLAGVAVLAFCSVPPLAAIVPIYWRGRQWALLAICVLEVLVIVLAASGILVGKH